RAKPAGRTACRRARPRGREDAGRLRRERRVVELKGMADDDARLELGGIEAPLAKLARQAPPRGVDRAAREWVTLRPSGRPRGPPPSRAPSAARHSPLCC